MKTDNDNIVLYRGERVRWSQDFKDVKSFLTVYVYDSEAYTDFDKLKAVINREKDGWIKSTMKKVAWYKIADYVTDLGHIGRNLIIGIVAVTAALVGFILSV